MARAATIELPGAEISGFTAGLPWRGPREENSDISPDLVTEPTVSAASAAPGALIVRSPLLPAAMTNSVPCSSDSRSTAEDSGSVPSEARLDPRLMLTTRASCATAHSIPARIQES